MVASNVRGKRTLALLTMIVGLAIGVGGCSSSVSAPAFIATGRPAVTEEPLATEAPPVSTAIPKPTESPKPPAKTPKPTKKPAAGYYKPPGWDGSSDVDCPDFDTHAHAQSFFKGTGGTTSNDPYRLDSDSDGIACESLP